MDIGASVQSAVWKKAVSSIFKITIKQRPGTLVLDPLSVILVLAINAFKPVGTKLYFGNGILELHDTGFLQSTVRAWCGETKRNIRLLNNPIIYACKHFFHSTHTTTEDIHFLFNHAVRGLENLRHTYRDDRDVIAYLNSYINIITTSKDMKAGASDVLDLLLKLKLTDVAIDSDTPVNATTTPSKDKSSANNARSTPAPSTPATTTSLPPHQPLSLVPVPVQDSAAILKANLFIELQRGWSQNKIVTMIGLLKELEFATPFGQKHLFVALEAFLICIHEKTKITIETLFDIK